MTRRRAAITTACLFNCGSLLVLTWVLGPSSNRALRMGRKLNDVKVWKNHSSLKYFLCLEPFQFSSVQFSHSAMSDSLPPHGPQHARPPCPSPTPWVYSNSCPLSQWCHPTISSSVVPFSSGLQSWSLLQKYKSKFRSKQFNNLFISEILRTSVSLALTIQRNKLKMA